MVRHVLLASLFTLTSSLLSSTAGAEDAPSAPPLPHAAEAARNGASPPRSPSTAPAPLAPLLVASPPTESAEPRSEELSAFVAFVEKADEPTRCYRLVGGLAALGVGGLVTPVGAAMVAREPGVAAGVTLGVGIGTALGGALVLLGSTPRPYRDAADAVASAKGLGRSDATALAAGEETLRRAAAEAQLERMVGGGVFLGLSVIALGFGTTFATADLTSGSFDRDEQDGVAAALMVGGALGTVGAVEILLSPTPGEMAWEGYTAGRRGSAALAPRVTSFGVAPLPEGGARLGLGGRF